MPDGRDKSLSNPEHACAQIFQSFSKAVSAVFAERSQHAARLVSSKKTIFPRLSPPVEKAHWGSSGKKIEKK